MSDNTEEERKQAETIKNGRKRDGTFAPGVAHSPGRPRKEDTASDCIREYLAGAIPTEEGQLTRMQILVRGMYKKAINGDSSMAKELIERGFGKVKDVVDMNTVQEIQLIDPVEKDI